MVGIRELKQNASAVISRVKAGESLVVTERGKPVAHLVPTQVRSVEELVEAGLASPAKRSLSDVMKDFPPAGRGPSLSQTLSQLREDNRS